MAEKKTKKGIAQKNRRVKETNLICFVLLYIVAIAGVGMIAYAQTENSFLDAKVSKYAMKYNDAINSEKAPTTYLDATLSEKDCTEEEGIYSCKKNISDSNIIKDFKFLVNETYSIIDGTKVVSNATVTVNATVIVANNGYEVKSISPKKFNGGEYALIDFVNQQNESYSIIVNSMGKIVYQ